MFAVIITLLVALPLLGFLVWQYLQEAKVVIESGHLGLVIVRGKAQEKALEPGVHYLFPFRRRMIQDYSMREVSFLASDSDGSDAPALATDIGGRSEAHVSYVLRYRIDPKHLHRVHEFIGPDGIYDLVRDYASQTIIQNLSPSSVEVTDLFGEPRHVLENRVSEALTEQLGERGILVTLFGLRDIDFGAVGEVLVDIHRAALELERESARSSVRRARLANEVEQLRELGELDDTAMRYLQIEAWREYVDRWDGRGQLPLAFPSVGDAPRATDRAATAESNASAATATTSSGANTTGADDEADS